MDNTLEKLAEKISLKLAEKLEKKEITISEMARAIDNFLTLSIQSKDIKEIENFVEKYD